MFLPSISTAIDYLLERGYGKNIPTNILAVSQSIKQVAGYDPLRQDLWASVYDNVYGFLNSNSQMGTYSRPLATELSRVYMEVADIAYVDGGGTLPLDEDTLSFAKAELQAQLSYIDGLFVNLKQMRKEGDFDAISEAFSRANGYTNSLDSFYNSIKVAGAGNKMLTFGGSDGKESCKDCMKYKGQRHRASWWISRRAVPPSRDFECKGYHCDHKLSDDDGNEFTI